MLTALGNTAANFLGGLTAMCALLLFNAAYLRMTPADEFGVISLLLTVSLILPALDLGTGRTAGRLIARNLATGEDEDGLRNSVLTLQLSSAAIGIGLGAAFAGASSAIARGWLGAGSMADDEVAAALVLIGALIPLIMARNFAYACLNGMQRQVRANVLIVTFILMGGAAGLVALYAGTAPLQAFLSAQIAVHVAEVTAAIAAAWRAMPGTGRPRPAIAVVRRTWRFASGDAGAMMIGAGLAHGDRILLSALLPLADYGPYALISTLAAGLGRFTGPFATAFLPHFVGLSAARRDDQLRADYLAATQLLAAVIVPLAMVMIAFAPEIVFTVLGATAEGTRLPLVLGLLVAATALNNQMHLPHGIQLAAGDSATAFRFTAANGLGYVVLFTLTADALGTSAPALSLLTVYSISFLLFTRRTLRLLDVPLRDWLLAAMVRPALAAAPAVLAAMILMPPGIGPVWGVASLALTVALACAAAVASSPDARRLLASPHARWRRSR